MLERLKEIFEPRATILKAKLSAVQKYERRILNPNDDPNATRVVRGAKDRLPVEVKPLPSGEFLFTVDGTKITINSRNNIRFAFLELPKLTSFDRDYEIRGHKEIRYAKGKSFFVLIGDPKDSNQSL